jgi:replicative DNA helicase
MELSNLKQDRNVRRKNTDISTLVYGKIPPQANELEEAVLGAIMLEKGAFDIVVEILRPECFYVEGHQKIFEAMRKLSDKSMPIDLLTVVEELKVNGDLELVGGPYYITKLTNLVASTANLEAHARIVLQKFIQREMIRISGEIISEAYEDSTDVFDLMDKAERRLYEITDTHLRKNYSSITDVLKQTMTRIEELRNSKEDLNGVPSGYSKLDSITRGWQSTDLIIIAARPSVGKTAFALNLALNAATHPTKPTAAAIFSLEMSAGQIVQRMLSMKSGVALERISSGKMEDYEMKQLNLKGIEPLSDIRLFIDDTPALNMFELRAKCRRLKHKSNLGVVLIDYLQLMSGSGDRGTNREQEISKISRDLKALAKELELPVIALSQLSREVERRRDGNKMPQLSDLRECVTGDTEVWLAGGGAAPIGELVGKSVHVWTLDADHRLTVSHSDFIWSVGKKPVFELRLASGKILKATAQHRILCASGWKTLEEVTPWEDYAAVSEVLPDRISRRRRGHPVAVPAGSWQDVFAAELMCEEEEEIAGLAGKGVRWEKITAVLACGEEEVFDLTVEKTHNWITGTGIVTHNSGAIEQDADMVMFLYRPEYYDQNTNEMGESIRGLTQIRIAKHRNGRLDTVDFRASLDIQKFEEIENADFLGQPPVPAPPGQGGPHLYIQKGSRMNNMNFEDGEETPF